MVEETDSFLTLRRIAALVVLALLVVFMLQNRVRTSVQLLVFEVTGPLWPMLLVTFILGVVVAWLLTGPAPSVLISHGRDHASTTAARWSLTPREDTAAAGASR